MISLRTARTSLNASPSRAVFRVFDIRVVNVMVLALTAALFIGYLAIITQSATNGFTIKTLERRIVALEDEKKRLDVEAVAHQSMATIEQRISELGLIPVSNVEYVSAAGSVVAVR